MEYNTILSLNSNDETYLDVLPVINFESQESQNFDLTKFSDLNLEVHLSQYKIFLISPFSEILKSVKDNFKARNFDTLDDYRISIAALFFNANINICPEDFDTRKKLLDLYDSIRNMP